MASATKTVLILTPVKNAASFLDAYFDGLAKLSYPVSAISLGFLESDSDDGTYDRIRDWLENLRGRYASAEIWRKNFDFRIPEGPSSLDPRLPDPPAKDPGKSSKPFIVSCA